MRTLSLFSGIGGFDLGFERAGMTVVGVCEIDKHAQKILQRHFPDATLHDDVRKVHYARGSVDLVCGGFPCQDLSVAGKRRGLDGERSGLWFEFARIIDETEPQWVVIENVPGLFSSDGGRDFATIIQWLAKRGYGVGWRVLDSQGFGLAQRRKRVFIVASFGNPSGCTLLLEPESVRWDTTSRRGERQGHTRAVAKRLMGHGWRGDFETETMITDVANTLTRQNSGDATRTGATLIPDVANALTAMHSVDESHGTMIPAVYAIDSQSSNSWKSKNPNSGIHEEQIARCLDTTGTNPTANQGGNVIVPFAIQGNIIDRQKGGANGIGISQSNISYTLTAVDRHAVAVQDIAPTLRAEAKQSLMSGDGNINAPLAIGTLWESSHGDNLARICTDQSISPTLQVYKEATPLIGVRRLTPIECERLQGFPDGWTSGQSDTHRYKQLGNAVSVPVAEWIGRRIMQS
jgi:DNA-cytosine methyltransferase